MQGFKFTCQAASYSDGVNTYPKGFTITLPEGDPRIHKFRGRRMSGIWKEEPVTLAGLQPPPAIPESPPVADPSVKLADLVTSKQLEALQNAGFHDLLDIAAAKMEDLRAIKGIDGKTVDKLLAAVN